MQVATMHAAAIAEDPSIFDYDSHYDAIQESRDEPKRQEKLARQSRYIEGLLEKAEERKRDQELQFERRLAKEREAENHLYGDKEKFITSAYRKKLDEDATLRAAQKQQQEEEERNAVEKKGHMGDFYRNLLKNNVAFGTATAEKQKKQVVNALHREANEKKEVIAEASDDIMPERRATTYKKELKHVERRDNHDNDDKNRVEGVQQGKGTQQGNRTLPSPAAGVVAAVEKMDAQGKDNTTGGSAEEEAVKEDNADARKNREEAVMSARERYLARKRKAAGDG